MMIQDEFHTEFFFGEKHENYQISRISRQK